MLDDMWVVVKSNGQLRCTFVKETQAGDAFNSSDAEVYYFDNLVEALEKLIQLGGTLTPQEYNELVETSPTTLVSYEVRMHFLPKPHSDGQKDYW